MSVFSPSAAPVINGWFTRVSDDGTYIAEPMEPLSRYQRGKGCIDLVEAGNPQELDWLCAAARMHAELVAKAERAAQAGDGPEAA